MNNIKTSSLHKREIHYRCQFLLSCRARDIDFKLTISSIMRQILQLFFILAVDFPHFPSLSPPPLLNLRFFLKSPNIPIITTKKLPTIYLFTSLLTCLPTNLDLWINLLISLAVLTRLHISLLTYLPIYLVTVLTYLLAYFLTYL